MRSEVNEGGAKSCLEWLAMEHQVADKAFINYELLQKKGVDFICLLDMMVSTIQEITKLRGHIREVQMENDVMKGEGSPQRMTR